MRVNTIKYTKNGTIYILCIFNGVRVSWMWG